MTDRADTIAADIEEFVRTIVVPYERDPRTGRTVRPTNWCRNCATRRAQPAC